MTKPSRKSSLSENKKSVLYYLESFLSQYRWPLLIGVSLLLIILPYIGLSQYIMRIIIMMGIYTMLGLGLNMLTGYTGMVSLGHAGFYGIGAYTSALLSLNWGLPFYLSAIAGTILAGLFGWLVSLPTLKLKGPYLTIVTLGFGEIAKMVFLNWKSVTRGAMGIRPIPHPTFFGVELTLSNNGAYYLMLAFLALITLFCILIVNSKFGRAFKTIKEDEQVAILMGIRTVNYRKLAFVLSASITGLAGAFYASFITYIDPNSFTNDISTMIVCVVILGGMGTIGGMFVGAILLVGFPEISRFLMEYRYVVYGLVLIVMMRWRPQGILGWQSPLPMKLPKSVQQTLDSRSKSPHNHDSSLDR